MIIHKAAIPKVSREKEFRISCCVTIISENCNNEMSNQCCPSVVATSEQIHIHILDKCHKSMLYMYPSLVSEK